MRAPGFFVQNERHRCADLFHKRAEIFVMISKGDRPAMVARLHIYYPHIHVIF